MKSEVFKPGCRVWFQGETRPYRVRATDGVRFVVCTKPFNPKRTVLYTVIDFERQVRGTEDLIFGLGAETDQQCREMCARLTTGESKVSYRNFVPLDITRFEPTHAARAR